MALFIERIDSAPIASAGLDAEMKQWFGVLVDTLNESIGSIETGLNSFDNGLVAPSFTTAEITALAVTAANGTMWYDTTTNQIKAKSNGIVVVIV